LINQQKNMQRMKRKREDQQQLAVANQDSSSWVHFVTREEETAVTLTPKSPIHSLHEHLFEPLLHRHYLSACRGSASQRSSANDPLSIMNWGQSQLEIEDTRLMVWKWHACRRLGENRMIQSLIIAGFLSRLRLQAHDLTFHSAAKNYERVTVSIPWMGDLYGHSAYGPAPSPSSPNSPICVQLRSELEFTPFWQHGDQPINRSWRIDRIDDPVIFCNLFRSENGQITYCDPDGWNTLFQAVGMPTLTGLFQPLPDSSAIADQDDLVRKHVTQSFLLDVLAELCSRNGLNPIEEFRGCPQYDGDTELYPCFYEYEIHRQFSIREEVDQLEVLIPDLLDALLSYLVAVPVTSLRWEIEKQADQGLQLSPNGLSWSDRPFSFL
jgi:hypothetical protein